MPLKAYRLRSKSYLRQQITDGFLSCHKPAVNRRRDFSKTSRNCCDFKDHFILFLKNTRLCRRIFRFHIIQLAFHRDRFIQPILRLRIISIANQFNAGDDSFFNRFHQYFSFKKLHGTLCLAYQIASWNSRHGVRRPRRPPRRPETRYRKLVLRSAHDLGVFNVLPLAFHLLRFHLLIPLCRIHAPTDRDSLLKGKISPIYRSSVSI